MSDEIHSAVCAKCGETFLAEVPEGAERDVYFKIQEEMGRTVCPECINEARIRIPVDWPEEQEIIRFIGSGTDGFTKGAMIGYVIRDGKKWMVEVVHPAIVEREGFADEVREKYAHLIGDEPWGYPER